MKKELGKLLRKAPATRSLGEAAYYLLVPAAFALAQLYYIRSAHIYFYHFLPLPLWAALAPSLPLLALEYAATRCVEGRRLGMTPAVRLGLYARQFFFAALCALFFFYPVVAQGGPSIFLPLIGLWHYIAEIVWPARPLPSLLAAAAMAAAYWTLVYRRSAFRLTVTIVLPGLATAALFTLIYFFPAALGGGGERPPAVERMFPRPGLEPADGRAWPDGWMFPHDVYAAPDDSWAAASFGATFAGGADGPTFVWIDLKKNSYLAPAPDSQVRRFSSECPDRLYFGPWHKDYIYSYRPGPGGPERIPLPELAGAGREIFAVHNACGRVYVLNNVTPMLFALDGKGRRLKTLSMEEAGLLENGSVVFQVIRDPRRRALLVSGYGRDPGGSTFAQLAYMAHIGGALPGRRIFRLDEDTLELTGSARPDHPPMDMAISPDGRTLYAPGVFHPEIYRFDAETLERRGGLPAPPHIRKLVFSADGKYLFAGSYLDGEVIVYDAASERRLGSFYVTPRIEGLHATRGYLYVAGAGGIFRIASGKIAGSLR